MSPSNGANGNGNHPENDATRVPGEVRGLLDSSTHDEDRLVAAVKEYTAAVESGRRPNRQEFLAQYADIATELSSCLNSLNFVQAAAAQLPGSDAASQIQKTSEELNTDMAAKPLGDFKLVREIGRGGMGVVYEAVQLSLGRRVAVKVLSLAAALDSRHLQRFKNEAQAAAQLHHTNIVPVYQVGCERSVHFYAMQLIDGQTLADVVRDLRRLAGKTPLRRDATAGGSANGANGKANGAKRIENLDDLPMPMAANNAPLSTQVANLSVMHSDKRHSFFRSVATLGLQAAEALDYAHRLGVVHRDIKPANLMLDVRGNLWITDFGLAQFYAADSGLTQTGDVVGTYRYMSPEQASGRAVVLDQRTDIYSLGVTLYELLTLERAVPGTTREELLNQIANVDPQHPREFDKAIPQELDTILMKAIAKEPADRYPSASALAEDLRRFLEDQPILARPPSTLDKAIKWTKRHRAITLSTMAILLVIAAGLLITTLFIARAQSHTNDALKREQENFRQARQAVDFFTNVANKDMENQVPGKFQSVRKEMLEASLAYYQSFIEQRKGDRTLEADLNAASAHVASILAALIAGEDYYRIASGLTLMQSRNIQAELKLTDPQKTKIFSLEAATPIEGPRLEAIIAPLTSEQRSEKLAAMEAETERAIADILSPDQVDRLHQLARQWRGPTAFSDTDVVAALALTREQKDQIRLIQNEQPPQPAPPTRPSTQTGTQPSDADRPPPRGPDQGQRGGFRQVDFRAFNAEKVARIVALLTPEQADRWQELIGAPFEGQFPNPFQRGGRGGGPGGRGRGGPGGFPGDRGPG
ncbi:MAG TPA: serine/threonine-protein kinase [Humisphaera sp.]|jgi:hypothetical protein|nr:serine/threonine-protein kinase [Humisphaera sp.]